jgi:ABC-2 type transport system permease protein
MSPRRSAAIARNELRVLRRDPMPLTVLLVMPVIMAALYRTTFRAALIVSGHPHVSGSDFAVPAMIVQFGFFLVPFTGFLFFREYMWKTWPRLRASGAKPVEIVLGKALPMVAIGMLQIVVLIVAGIVLLDLHATRSLAPLATVAGVYVITAVVIGVALTGLVRTSQQLNAIGFLGATVLGAIGGALVPLSTLPAWTHHVAPGTPQYWAMRASRDLLLDHESWSVTLLPLGILAVFALVAVTIAVRRLSFDDRNVGWY